MSLGKTRVPLRTSTSRVPHSGKRGLDSVAMWEMGPLAGTSKSATVNFQVFIVFVIEGNTGVSFMGSQSAPVSGVSIPATKTWDAVTL